MACLVCAETLERAATVLRFLAETDPRVLHCGAETVQQLIETAGALRAQHDDVARTLG